jgi:hypothetical protein
VILTELVDFKQLDVLKGVVDVYVEFVVRLETGLV